MLYYSVLTLVFVALLALGSAFVPAAAEGAIEDEGVA